MRKRLIMMRHGHAENESMTASDQTRKLTEIGQQMATARGQQLKSLQVIPELILTSNATRAIESVHYLLAGVGTKNIPITELASFYFHGISHMVKEVESLDESLSTVLIVGHNPWISDAISLLTEEHFLLSPAAMAILSHEGTSWQEAIAAEGSWVCDSYCPK